MPLSLLNHSALALFAQRTRIPTSARSIGFCAIWVCISSSSSVCISCKAQDPHCSCGHFKFSQTANKRQILVQGAASRRLRRALFLRATATAPCWAADMDSCFRAASSSWASWDFFSLSLAFSSASMSRAPLTRTRNPRKALHLESLHFSVAICHGGVSLYFGEYKLDSTRNDHPL